VSGVTGKDRVFTSARILQPVVAFDVKEASAAITASGTIPRSYAGQGDALVGDIEYRREFHFDAKGLKIRTDVHADGRDELAELCETLPVFIANTPPREGTSSVDIQFRSGEQWGAAGVEYQDRINAIKVKRNEGTMLISFASPQRVKLSPRVWTDQYQSRATCRTILIDLLAGRTPFKEATLEYTITPMK